MILEALALMGHDPAGTLTLATQVSEALAQNQWMSTQTTSMSLVSLARFAQVGGTSGEIKAKAEVDGGKATRLDSAKTMASASLGARDTAARIAVTNEGSGPVFARLVASGRPPIGQEQALSKGLALEVAYVHAVSGERVNPADLDQGTDFRVQVVVKNTSGRALNELALTQIVPSGWEIHGTAPGKGANWEYRDVRDDRVMTYFDLKPGEARSFEWSLHAAYLGRFWMPAITVEAMYDAGIVGRTPGAWVEVSDASVEG
jgi:uncharacterized protein YfaS (alpha-2-macroglobulin family)